jgi:hypothetical protein
MAHVPTKKKAVVLNSICEIFMMLEAGFKSNLRLGKA